MAGIEEAVEIEPPETVECEAVEVKNGADITSASAAQLGRGSARTRKSEQVVAQEVKSLAHRKAVIKKDRLLGEGQRWSEDGSITSIGDRCERSVECVRGRRRTWGWTEQSQRRVAPPRADPHAVGMPGDGVSASHGFGRA